MALSTYTNNNLINCLCKQVAFPTPASFFIGLSSTVPTAIGGNITEPSGNGYVRVGIPQSVFPTSTVGSTSNSTVSLAIPNVAGGATGSWCAGANMVAVIIYDALSGGNFLGWGTVSTPAPVTTGQQFNIPIGDLIISNT